MTGYDDLPARPYQGPCRNPHLKETATGNAYDIENVIGQAGAIAPGCNVINAEAFAVKGPGFCAPKLSPAPGACGIKQE
jgi:hypothetical protein